MLSYKAPFRVAVLAFSVAVISGCGAHSSSVLPAGTQSESMLHRSAFETIATAGVSAVTHQPPVPMQFGFLMTDGTVLAQTQAANTWYRYTPDISGNYANGTWSAAATLPAGYSPGAFASAVLSDGRLVIIGGEYNGSNSPYELQLTNLGAVYDPEANAWTPIGHPTGWHFIGDSPASVLPDGRFFVGQKLTEAGATLGPKTLTWAMANTSGKSDFNAEEGFTLLPDGSVLTADVKNAPNSERYLPSGTWVTAGSTIVDLHSPTTVSGCIQYGPAPQDCYYPPGEIGPAMLRPDGTVFATGSGSGPSGNGAGHTAIYTPASNSWSVGPDFPNGDNAGDSFAVLLPSGNVLVFGVSGALYEFNGTTFVQTGGASGTPVLLPTGQVLMIGNSAQIYTPKGSPQSAWRPLIKSVPSTLTRGSSYTVSGFRFNGMSQASAFGDEYQNATNYPLVRITVTATNHVFYARTHDHTSMGVATGSLRVSTTFDVPASMEAGAATLQVVANGVASAPVAVTVQ